jgi:hypothetical protein
MLVWRERIAEMREDGVREVVARRRSGLSRMRRVFRVGERWVSAVRIVDCRAAREEEWRV